ncbi:RNA-dependent RNA polymerase [Alternaria dianthicola dsRNA virus 1]|uniref:RNA-dependent RNA polymerase n=1 Tax=Alternaria dianthicola dsRNA virus 1 TaxID=2813952 RepID=A0A895HKU2_9VIRU|nr:RNA-dependent RNA polymerase [Alternaria dianthicola dsRNA virus 1]
MSEFVPPSEEDLWKHICGFGENSNFAGGPLKASVSDMLEELGRLEPDRPEITEWLTPTGLTKIKVPAATSPGIRWKKMGYRTKREALMPAVVEASRVLGRMQDTQQEYTVPPAGVAGRGKRVALNRPDDPERKEGRLIVMPDLVRHLMGALGSGPYMQMQRRLDKRNGGVMLGMGPFHESYSQLADWAGGAKGYVFIDFKKFDQRIPRRVLRAVMKHIARAFRKENGSGAYWASEFRHLVDTEIAMPNGSVYRKKMGVASGDPWTSLADSYANWIMLQLACRAMGWESKIWTFGDDSVIAIMDGDVEGDPLARISQWLKGEFGMNVSEEKSYFSQVLVDIDDEPQEKASGSFLSMYFVMTPTGVRPVRPIQDFYELFLKPERNRDNVAWEVTRTSMAYLVFYYNPNVRHILQEYWDWLHEKYKIPELTGTVDDIRTLREMDIPWSLFQAEWLIRLPHPWEVELLYKYGHTRFYPPILWQWVYRRGADLPGGNRLD